MLGGSQLHVGEEGEKKGGGSSTRPTRPVQSCPVKRAQSWGSDVDYKGGASCKTADVRVCGEGGSLGRLSFSV